MEEYEVRKDRATEIPCKYILSFISQPMLSCMKFCCKELTTKFEKVIIFSAVREVENLLQDLLEARLLPSPEHLEQTIDSVKVIFQIFFREELKH